MLESKIFLTSYGKIRQIYNKDKKFQKYVLKDLKKFGLELNENNLKFILEEILIFYLVAKKEIKLKNKFLYNNYKWCLNCYPGMPLYSEIYLFQLNPLKLKSINNNYESSFYDLKDKKIYHFDKINLEELK